MRRTVYAASFGATATLRRETAFDRERRAFRLLLPTLSAYEGQFVAIHEGWVIVTDRTRNGALRKFFSRYPIGTSVYIGFVGQTPIARVTAPIRGAASS